MMEQRLIDANALRAKAVYMRGFGENKYVPLKAIENAPAADVEVVKHGRWERLPDNEEWAYCSQCHCCWEWEIINSCNVRYCPNCGCKDDGGYGMSRQSNFKLYRVWDGIVQRCCNPKAKNYHNYGARGIKMHDDWRNSFSVFEDYCLANGWKRGLQIDRIDNDGDYTPGNIRFVTQAVNLRNKRTNHFLTMNGETMCVADWCKALGISDSTVWRRLKSGWSVEDALTKPIQKHTREKMDLEVTNGLDQH